MKNNEIKQIEISKLRFFGGSYGTDYFHIKYDKLNEIKESIRTYGILEPIIVRPDPTGQNDYEIIAGKTRTTAAKQIGLKVVPCIVRNLNNWEALALYGESNRNRVEFTICEKAYMLRYDMEYRENIRENSLENNENGTAVPFIEKTLTDRQKRNYIRLTYLHPDLQHSVDVQKLSIKVGAALSYLSTELQQTVYFVINGTNLVVTLNAVEELKALERIRIPYAEKVHVPEVYEIIEKHQTGKKETESLRISKKILSELPPDYNTKQKKVALIESLLKTCKKI